MTEVQREMIDFIKRRGGPVTDIDLAEHFDVLADPSRVFSIHKALGASIQQGLIEPVPVHSRIKGGRLAVKLTAAASA